MSNQSPRLCPSRISFPHWSISPLARNTWQPERAASATFVIGVLPGMKQTDSKPARAAYIAIVPPALPLEAIAIRRTPKCRAIVVASESPRALKLQCGRRDSSLIITSRKPKFPANRGQSTMGVTCSSSVTGAISSPTGNSSRYRHIVAGRDAICFGDTTDRMASKSYRDQSGRPSCQVCKRSAGYFVPSIALSKCVMYLAIYLLQKVIWRRSKTAI